MLQKGAGCILFTGATSSVRGGAIIPESAESAEPAEPAEPAELAESTCAVPGLQRDLEIVPNRRHGIDLPLEKTFN